eukprot:857750-Pelagomonas_calceolata.AAC.9
MWHDTQGCAEGAQHGSPTCGMTRKDVARCGMTTQGCGKMWHDNARMWQDVMTRKEILLKKPGFWKHLLEWLAQHTSLVY